jgi:hypothetical protein
VGPSRTSSRENVHAHDSARRQIGVSADAWASDAYQPRRRMIFNGEAIDIVHMPNAH